MSTATAPDASPDDPAQAGNGALLERTLSILATLVRFDTTSRNSNLPLIAWTEQYLRRFGFRTERLMDSTGTRANLLASIGPADTPGYILSAHTDTVPVDGQIWTGDPFALRVDGSRAYGRGACDMKGFLAACLSLAPTMAATPLRRPLHFALSYDEEVGCVGAKVLCRHIRDSGLKAEACFVGEPTAMQVVIGHKSKRNVRVNVKGRTCHSSLAPLGVNAVEWGALLIAEVRRMAERLASTGPCDALYDVSHSTAHVGVFDGGTALNVVPAEAEFLFEFRTIVGDDPDALMAAIERFARVSLEPAMQAIDPEAGFSFQVYADSPGLEMSPDAAVVSLAKRLAGRNDHAKVAYMTEAGLFQQIADIPTVVIGPGSIEQAHKPDEWIALSELASCVSFTEKLIEHCRRPGTRSEFQDRPQGSENRAAIA